MRNLLSIAVLAAAMGSPVAVRAESDVSRSGRAPPHSLYDPFGPYGGLAPWSRSWEYDTGGDNDKRPELPRFQQGGGQQTGGPARNLVRGDGLHIVPR